MPEYATFAELHTKLTVEPANWGDCNIRMVALGDSVTQGLTLNPQMIGNGAYHEILRQKLIAHFPDRSFSSINAGIGGDNAPSGLRRLQTDVLDHRPDLVVVCYGLNDCWPGIDGLEQFRAALTGIANRVREKCALILMTPNMIATRDTSMVDPNFKSDIQQFVALQNDGILARYAQVIREVALETATPLADAYAEWERRHNAGEDITRMLTNGINHPDAEGHGIFASLLWAVLKRELSIA